MAKVLGKGLHALIKEHEEEKNISRNMLPLNTIIPNKYQPRQKFNQESMLSLINSIKNKGILQPLTVRELENNKFELIAGERRLRAAKELKIKNIPVYIIKVKNDSEMTELALIENIQRVNLNPIEEAEGFFLLQEKYHYSQVEIGNNIGKSRSEIANKIRLLKLPEQLITSIHQNKISYGHARALLGINNTKKLIMLYHKIIKNKLNVRQTESLIGKYKKTKKTLKQNKNLRKDLSKYENKISSYLSTKIKISSNKKYDGKIHILFKTKNELLKLIQLIMNK